MRFNDYNMQDLTQFRGDNIPLTIHLASKIPHSGVTEELFLCEFDRKNQLKPTIKIRCIFIGFVIKN